MTRARAWPIAAKTWCCLLLSGITAGCGPAPASLSSVGWTELPPLALAPHPNERWLRGRRIGLDPGHGAETDPAKQFEADVNLAVALELTRMLERAGAVVLLTRREDEAVPLERRAPLLVEQGAEVFISIHHNAGGTTANYTSTWYHQDLDSRPASLDLARYVQQRVMEALRTPASVPTPILSDRLIYERSGFAVLRTASVPAILCEASFYTHPEEAERLRSREYNQREAYGYYLGLVDYFQGGTPRVRLEACEPKGGQTTAVFDLDDGLRARGGWGADEHRVLSSTISCKVGGRSLNFAYDRATSRLRLPLSTQDLGQELEIRFENIYKHSNFPSRFRWVEEGSRPPESGSSLVLEPVLEGS